MPSRRQVRMMRQAISPRLAIRIFSNMPLAALRRGAPAPGWPPGGAPPSPPRRRGRGVSAPGGSDGRLARCRRRGGPPGQRLEPAAHLAVRRPGCRGEAGLGFGRVERRRREGGFGRRLLSVWLIPLAPDDQHLVGGGL